MSAAKIALVLVCLAVVGANANNCGTCQQSSCTPADDLKCDWGIVWDDCNCCHVCTQGPSEKCGGEGNKFGKCGVGLTCVPSSPKGSEGTCQRQLLPVHQP
ncbi:insulin-like growth factor-binding protein 7 [Macrobrachium rosenbergii]|uniref:insulin-like growth factor-binding protein 7 n=1 Tax=Macrobrachium rosenbergii TaxID=79674 RepID=UPI0034D48CF2